MEENEQQSTTTEISREEITFGSEPEVREHLKGLKAEQPTRQFFAMMLSDNKWHVMTSRYEIKRRMKASGILAAPVIEV